MRVDKNKDLIHFIGIGGIGMSAIAHYFMKTGYKVQGSDVQENKNIRNLRELGINIFIGHDKDNLKESSIVVYSSAISKDNVEMQYADENSIKIYKRADALKFLSGKKKNSIAIAGSHGKTTTSSMLTSFMENMGQDPSFIIGGHVKEFNSNLKVGATEYFIYEADESDGSFLIFEPESAIITNVDNDHLNFYKTEDNIHKAFTDFINKVEKVVLVNIDDRFLFEYSDSKKSDKIKTYSTEKPDADYFASNIVSDENGTQFDVAFNGKKIGTLKLKLYGNYNVSNALAAYAMSHINELEVSEVSSQYEGVSRRFDLVYNNDDMKIYDDYAHHPNEIKNLIESVSSNFNSRIIYLFEPHRFTRTRDCWSEFISCFRNIENVFILPIYSAGETKIEGISSDNLVREINKISDYESFLINSVDELFKKINSNEKNIIVCMGAGPISNNIRKYVSERLG